MKILKNIDLGPEHELILREQPGRRTISIRGKGQLAVMPTNTVLNVAEARRLLEGLKTFETEGLLK